MDYDNEIRDFVKACRKAGEYGLQLFSSGNMSCRVSDGKALLSASRSWLKELTPEQVAICNIESGKCENGLTPTVESVFHLGILKNRPEVNVVFHFQSPYATAMCCGEPENVDFFVLPEIPYYIGAPAIVEAMLPGSNELAKATIKAMQNSNMAILKNHGLVTAGSDYNEAIQRAGFFELACQAIITNPKTKPLPQKIIDNIGTYSNK